MQVQGVQAKNQERGSTVKQYIKLLWLKAS